MASPVGSRRSMIASLVLVIVISFGALGGDAVPRLGSQARPGPRRRPVGRLQADDDGLERRHARGRLDPQQPRERPRRLGRDGQPQGKNVVVSVPGVKDARAVSGDRRRDRAAAVSPRALCETTRATKKAKPVATKLPTCGVPVPAERGEPRRSTPPTTPPAHLEPATSARPRVRGHHLDASPTTTQGDELRASCRSSGQPGVRMVLGPAAADRHGDLQGRRPAEHDRRVGRQLQPDRDRAARSGTPWPRRTSTRCSPSSSTAWSSRRRFIQPSQATFTSFAGTGRDLGFLHRRARPRSWRSRWSSARCPCASRP